MSNNPNIIREAWTPSKRDIKRRHNVFVQFWRFTRMSAVMFWFGVRKHD